MLYVLSFGGHSISKWQQLPWLREIDLFQTPSGNSIPSQLPGLEGRCKVSPDTPGLSALSRGSDTFLGSPSCGSKGGWEDMSFPWSVAPLGRCGGSKGAHRIAGWIPQCFGVALLAKRALAGKQLGNLGKGCLLFLFLSFPGYLPPGRKPGGGG